MTGQTEPGAEHHTVDGVLYLCHEGDHYCTEAEGARRYRDAVNAPLTEQAADCIGEHIRNGTAPRRRIRRKESP